MNTYIRAAASFCDKNTLVKVCRVWSEPEPDGLGLGLPYRRRRKTMFVPFKNIHEGDKLSVFDGDSEFHYTADEDAAEERDALRKNDSNWSVNVTDDNGRTKKLFPSDFAPYIIYLSVVKKGDWRGSNLVFESVFNSSEDIIRGLRSIFERHVKDESGRRLSGAERISDMAKKYLTPEHTEQFGFRFIAEGMNFVRSDINDILPNDWVSNLHFTVTNMTSIPHHLYSLPSSRIWANTVSSPRGVPPSQTSFGSWMNCTATCPWKRRAGLWSISSGLGCCWRKARSCLIPNISTLLRVNFWCPSTHWKEPATPRY